MKRKAVWKVVGLVAIAFVVVAVARADFGKRHGWCENRWHGAPLGHVARELNLSDTQISQIRSIWMEERPTATALLKNLVSGLRQLNDAAADRKVDEDKVQALAATEGNTFARLIVEKERFKSRVYAAVLNEEQRQLADKIQQRWIDRMDRAVTRLDKQGQ